MPDMDKLFEKLEGAGRDLMDKVTDGAKDLYEKAKPVVQDTVQKAGDGAKDLYEKAKPMVQDTVQKAGDSAKDLYEKARPVAEKVMETAKDSFENLTRKTSTPNYRHAEVESEVADRMEQIRKAAEVVDPIRAFYEKKEETEVIPENTEK